MQMAAQAYPFAYRFSSRCWDIEVPLQTRPSEGREGRGAGGMSPTRGKGEPLKSEPQRNPPLLFLLLLFFFQSDLAARYSGTEVIFIR